VLRTPIEVTGQEVYLSASVGIATARRSGPDLLRNADLAMYQAKSRGKDRYELFEPSMHAAIVRRLELEGDLQRAVDRGEFCLCYQPIVRLRTGRIVGVEALLRWRHPERGLVPPAAFIPLAEETRLIVPIGRWVLREACRQAALWRESRPALAIAVNLSSMQLQQPELAAEVAGALGETSFDARSLILEITETMLMQDVESTKARLRELKELGVQLAVDDFGTGYSSLQYLRRFPIDILKIAKSFVDGVAGASDESALARAIIDLGESFQLRVVAEGIEQEEQLAKLVALGCQLGQGYLFARPMPARDIEPLLESPDEPTVDVLPLGGSTTAQLGGWG
jgi:EAL domain-containing protein (putative c-di-GMP-specific phosphodiesterase class I)